MAFTRAPFDQQRTYGVVRSTLIGYGVAALTFLFSRSSVFGVQTSSSAPTLVLAGLTLQVLLIAVRALIKHKAAESETATQGLMVLELVADGVTVFLFAWATLGTVIQASGNV